MPPRFRPLIALTLTLALAGCTAARGPAAGTSASPPSASASGLDLSAMDRKVAPGDDFYAFANGSWFATAQIPPDRSFAGAILGVIDTVEGRTRALVEEAVRADAPPGSDTRKVGDCYATIMDEAGIEARGLARSRSWSICSSICRSV